MEGANPPSREPISLLKLHTQEDVKEIATGCDADIGGTSTLNFALDESPGRNQGSGSLATARFWGEIRLAVRPEFQGRIRGGYAGFRTKVRIGVQNGLSPHPFLSLSPLVGRGGRPVRDKVNGDGSLCFFYILHSHGRRCLERYATTCQIINTSGCDYASVEILGRGIPTM